MLNAIDCMLVGTESALSDIEMNLANGAAYIPVVPGGVKMTLGGIQTVSAVALTILSAPYAVVAEDLSLTKHFFSHVGHGIANVVSGLFEAFPGIGWYLYHKRCAEEKEKWVLDAAKEITIAGTEVTLKIAALARSPSLFWPYPAQTQRMTLSCTLSTHDGNQMCEEITKIITALNLIYLRLYNVPVVAFTPCERWPFSVSKETLGVALNELCQKIGEECTNAQVFDPYDDQNGLQGAINRVIRQEQSVVLQAAIIHPVQPAIIQPVQPVQYCNSHPRKGFEKSVIRSREKYVYY